MSETREDVETREGYGDLYYASLEWLKNNLTKTYGSLNRAYHELGASKTTLYKALKEDAVPRAKEYLHWLDQQGVELKYPDEVQIRECQPEVKNFDERPLTATQAKHLKACTFKMIPVYRKTDLLQTLGRSEEWKDEPPADWVLTTDSFQVVPENSIGIRIPSHDRSMTPTLNPGDVVVVDLDTTWRGNHNDIHLVRCADGDMVFRRVCLQPQKCAHTGELVQLACLQSDNVSEYVPIILNLKADYGNKLDRAILGRVTRVVHAFP